MTANTPLTGRRAVVTGASSGIGAATARLLAAQGARVALVARRRDRLDAVRKEIENAGGSAVAVPVDLTAGQVDGQAVARELGGVDLLVNAAGILTPGLAADGRIDEWERQIEVNLTGLLRATRAFLPFLTEAAATGGPADLVNISSVAASRAEFGTGVYAATKAAVSHLSRNLRLELAPGGVRVTDIQPGMVVTDLLSGSELGTAWAEDMKTRIDPLAAEDLAEVVAFAVGRPAHVCLPEVIVMPAKQT